MVNSKGKTIIEESLSPEAYKELFFYNHFTMREKTVSSSGDFIENLLSEHYL